MRILDRLAWPLTILGFIVILAALVSYVVEDNDLATQWQIAAQQWRTNVADVIARKRAKLTPWPGVIVGTALTGAGLVLLELRRRRQAGWIDREGMEAAFEDGRPIGFKPPERGSD
jgi:hypothetical protein